MAKHWALISLEKQIIELMEYPKGYKLIPAKPHRPRWAERIAKKRVRLYLPPMLERYTTAINFPLHQKYYGAICQAWVINTIKDKYKEDIETICNDNLRDYLERWLGYPEKEWWFSYQIGDGWESVPYDENLQNIKYLAIEDETGKILDDEYEDLSEQLGY